jgi:CRISPR-associated protein Cmr6
MPIAAVPAYLPDKLLADASPGLRFGMYLSLWDVKLEIRPEAKRSALNGACRFTPSDRQSMQALAQRQHALADPLVKSGALVVLEADAVAPFTTGLGNEHPLENGFAFLNPYGLPYLPGSGVKGVVRQAARELASGEWGDTNGWNLDESYLLRIGKEEITLSLLDVLFGRETPSSESGHVRGALSFWDVIPQIEGERLAVEVMTPHQGHYYQQGGTPHDSGSPTPINFLTVPPKSRFTFHVLCDRGRLRRLAPSLAEGEHWKGLVEAAFQHAFQWLGFGAKTSVGYGAFALATQSVGTGGQPPAPSPTERPRAQRTEAGSETIWPQARLRYDRHNGTLIAIGPGGTTANALAPRGAEILARLPAEAQRRVSSNQFTRAIARVRGFELIDVEVKS